MIFDSHAHYDDEAFDQDREHVFEKIKNAGVCKVMNVGASMNSTRNSIEYMEKYDFIYGALGVHPDETGELTEADMQFIKDACCMEKVRAIGEIGLDYHWDTPVNQQKIWFDRQLELAKEVKLPVIIHSREACKDTMDMLKTKKDITGIIHCFSYTKETAREYLDMGYVIGVGGVVTFKNSLKLKEVVEYIPLEAIVLETDCPYLAPTPHRGERNDSSYISLVIDEIARIKNVDRNLVEETCYSNTLKVYGLTK